jgi:acyl carrier protein
MGAPDLGVSMGLDLYELVLEVEEEFGVRIPDADMQQVESVGDLFAATVKNVVEQHPERFAGDLGYEHEVWERLKALLVYQLGVKPEQIVPSARFFYELGID